MRSVKELFQGKPAPQSVEAAEERVRRLAEELERTDVALATAEQELHQAHIVGDDALIDAKQQEKEAAWLRRTDLRERLKYAREAAREARKIGESVRRAEQLADLRAELLERGRAIEQAVRTLAAACDAYEQIAMSDPALLQEIDTAALFRSQPGFLIGLAKSARAQLKVLDDYRAWLGDARSYGERAAQEWRRDPSVLGTTFSFAKMGDKPLGEQPKPQKDHAVSVESLAMLHAERGDR